MAINVGVVEVTVVPNTAGLSSAISAAGSQAATGFSSSFASKMKTAGASMSRVGKSLTRTVTLPLLAIGAVSTKMALDFDTAFSKMSVLAGDLGVSLEEAKKRVQDLSIRTGQDPTELANALYFTASAGLAASKVMPVLAQSAKAAAAGMGDASTIAQTLTSVLNAYADTGLKAANVTNILTEAVKVGKAEPAELADNIGQVIPVAAQMGITFDQVAASIAAATNIGVSTARASTGLRFLISSFQKPTAEAKDVIKEFGFTVGGLQKDLADPAVGLLGTLKELADKFDLTTVAGKAAFATVVGGARGAVLANALVGKNFGEVAKAFDEVAASAKNGSTVFNDAFKKMNATPAQQLARAMSELKVAAIELGNELIPILTHDIIPAVKSAVEWFRDLSPEAKSLGLKLAGLAVVAGPLLRVAGALTTLGASILRLPKILPAWLSGGAGGLPAAGAGAAGTLAFLPAAGATVQNVPSGMTVDPRTGLILGPGKANLDPGSHFNTFPSADAPKQVEELTQGNVKLQHSIEGLIAGAKILGRGFSQLTLQQSRNLLAMGDERGAVKVLNDALRDSAPKLREASDAEQEAAENSAKLANNLNLIHSPKPIEIKVTDHATAALLAIQNRVNNLARTYHINLVTDTSGGQHGGQQEHGGFFPGAASGGFVSRDQIIRVGEHSKPEMILPLQDASGIAALTKALERAGAGNRGSGRLHVISGRVDLDTGQIRIVAREEIDDDRSHNRALALMA